MTIGNGEPAKAGSRLQTVSRMMRQKARQQMSNETNELTHTEWNAAISMINAIVREPYQAKDGDFSVSITSTRSPWFYDLETRGYVEIGAHYTNDGRPVVINRDELAKEAA